jgi:type II secretory pathway pseudopilin PulG
MIELLIVIAVLGVLAVAVLATINPLEQINRGRDTSSRSDTEQLLSAIDRYNANKGLFPWQDVADDLSEIAWQPITSTGPTSYTYGCTLMEQLSTTTNAECTGTEEIKQSFVERVTSPKVNVLNIYKGPNSGDSVYICFNPQSKSFQQEADGRCDGGTLPTDFPPDVCGNCPDSLGKNPTANCSCLP